MVAEAARMKKEAEKMDPTVSPKIAVPEVTESAPAPKARGRKPKSVMADAAQ
jgi:hypothetical protein